MRTCFRMTLYAISFIGLCFVDLSEARAQPAEEEALATRGPLVDLAGASDPSLGLFLDEWGNRVPALAFLDTVREEPMVLFLDSGAGVIEPPRKDPEAAETLELEHCMWGGNGILFCQGRDEYVYPPPFPPIVLTLDVVHAWDYNTDEYYVAALPAGFIGASRRSVLRDTYEEFVVVESEAGDVVLLWPSVEYPNMLDSQVIAVGEGYSRHAVVGPGGGAYPQGDIEVVFQEEAMGTWTLEAWSRKHGRVVSSVPVGTSQPRPSDMYGYVYFDGEDSGSVMIWDTTPPPPPAEPGQDPILYYPPTGTLLSPEVHDCESLKGVHLGEFFALVQGQNCGPADETKLYAVTMRDGGFVAQADPLLYQPFLVSASQRLGKYSVLHEWLAYEDEDGIVVRGVDLPRLQHTRRYGWSLSPWNIQGYAEDEIDFAAGQTHREWRLHLSEHYTYRVIAVSDWNCLNWYANIRFSVSGPGVAAFVTENETGDSSIPAQCPAVEIAPLQTGWYDLLVDREELGEPKLAPSMPYHLVIQPLER